MKKCINSILLHYRVNFTGFGINYVYVVFEFILYGGGRFTYFFYTFAIFTSKNYFFLAFFYVQIDFAL